MGCVCCCPNRTEDGKPCICGDATQMVIEVPPLLPNPNIPGLDCGSTGATIVVDFVNEEQGSKPGWVVTPTLCDFLIQRNAQGQFLCRHVGPGVSGGLFETTGIGTLVETQFFEGAPPTGASGEVSDNNESCGSFAAGYNFQIFHAPTLNGVPCLPSTGGGFTLQ
jgi:hypothetical protein